MASPADVPFDMVPKWYKRFRPDRFGRVEIKKPTGLCNQTSTTQSCAEDQILEHLILRTNFCMYRSVGLNDQENSFLKSGNQAVNANHRLGRADSFMCVP